MLATFEAEQLIDSQSYEGIDRIFTGSIPEETKPDANSTDILITESAGDMPEDYGNDDFVNLNRAVEVQIFLPKVKRFKSFHCLLNDKLLNIRRT